MKKIVQAVLTLIFLVSLGATLQAQTIEQILTNYYKNINADKWKTLNTMKMEGEASVQGMTLNMTMLQKRPNLEKVVIDVMGKQVVEAYDGKDAWRVNPFMGGAEPVKKDAEEVKEASKKMFEDDLIGYKEKGHKVEFQGKEEIDGAPTLKVKLTKKDGDELLYFFDPENYVPIMVRSFASSGPSKGQAMETYLSNYEKEGDMMMPHALTNKMNGQTFMEIKITKIEMNPKIEETEFAFPEKK